MNKRLCSLMLLCLLLLAGVWLFRPAPQHRGHSQQSAATAARPTVTTTRSASTAPLLFTSGNSATNGVAKTNEFAYRLTNTQKSLAQLMGDPHAILLENALLDTRVALNLSIPKQLQVQGDPGAYIVQANGSINNAFRAALAAAGAQIVSYIPNNAFLVTVSAGGAAGLSGRPGVQSVNPYEPYYKISASLLALAVNQKNLADNSVLTLGLFPNTAAATVDQIKQLGATVVATDQSPFGPIVRVTPPQNWTALAVLPGVQIMELAHRRAVANDLARVTLNISADTVTLTNYLGLSGSNVLVEVNDTGIDATHPDFTASGNAAIGPSGPTRIIGASALSTMDVNGHGTHVAGIIAGNGSMSYSVTNIPQGSVTNADFRGKAPAARLYSVAALDNTGTSDTSDYYLQTAPALTNALISNNSWTFVGDATYDLAAASYDAAVRDALPTVTGSQPVLFVFAAGNEGGDPDSITSPGTAKDVITVGALQQLRGITNVVTDAAGNSNAVWLPETENPNQVAGYSGLGNVGIGTEGSFGRFKPDVVAPGSFVVSTRSEQWDKDAYYNPTNYFFEGVLDQFVEAGSTNNIYSLSLNFIPPNTILYSNVVAVNIAIVPNQNSPVPFPPLSIYVSSSVYPDPANPGTYDFVTTNYQVSIPPDGGASYLAQIQGGNLFFNIVNTNSERVGFDIIEEITVTNQNGNLLLVLSNLNETIGPWYRYESGTSMAAPAVSGTLALIQDYFTNTLHATPSPALLKAMLINGARQIGNYNFAVTNGNNYEGWGLPNIQNSVPAGLTNQLNAPCSTWFTNQSPLNALATGDSQTYLVTVATNTFAQAFPLQVTLAWTDPPGNPAAAIKLVNILGLVITNLDTGEVFFGNDFDGGIPANSQAWNTNQTPFIDNINNVENVLLSPLLAGSYSVTVIGRSVNVNAVTAQTNNTVQDYALVIACGEGEVTNAITVTASAPVSNPTGDQDVTVVGINANGMSTNTDSNGGVFLNQLAGASTPLLGTNMVDAITNYTGTAVVTMGMTNQWHFYVVQNNTTFSNAAFVTFLPDTLSMPRMGVFVDPNADPSQNPTTPEADIDMYVSTDPSLTNLNPVVISNCVNGTQIGVSAGGPFNGSSLSGGGTEFVVDTGSKAGQVYYVGVKSETAIAGEYGFLPVFSQEPFSQTQNGIETVNGLLLPMPIPDGSPKHPGTAYIFALAIQPIQVQDVIVSNQIVHQRFGDLVGTLTHNGKPVVLNIHNSPLTPPEPGPYTFNYYDGPQPPQTAAALNTQPTDGPGSLNEFQGQQGIGPWILTEVDDSLTQTGAVTGLTLTVTPHQNLNQGVNISVQAQGYFYGFIDVPVGTTNLTITATNISGKALDPNHYTLQAPPFGILYEKLGQQPAPPPTPLTNFDQSVLLDNFGPFGPGGSIFVTPFDTPPIEPGRYYVTLYNPALIAQQYFILATLGIGQVQPVDFTPAGPVPLLDDAVSYASINNPFTGGTNETIASIAVGIRVDHPRISDLVFTLISPDGTRYLLMQNRGNTSTNGAGATVITTNIFSGSASGGSAGATNFYDLHQTSGTIPITWNFFTVPDTMDVYYQGTNIFSTGLISGSGATNINFGPGISTQIEVVMDATNHPPATLWTYTIGGVQTNFAYLTFTDDTNLTLTPVITPIKFAPTPFVPVPTAASWSDNFDSSGAQTYPQGQPFGNNWTVLKGSVAISTNPPAHSLPNLLALGAGAVSNNLPTVAGQRYTLSYFVGSSATDNGLPSTNAGWQMVGISFTATKNGTPLVLDASGSGLAVNSVVTNAFDTNVVFDDFSLTEVPGDLHYQPEQDLTPLIGTSAYGLWQLEIQDDRVGATNNAVLDSWQLQFVFADTNPATAILIPGTEICNPVPANDTLWYQVNVPLNALFATNTLVSSDQLVNLLINTNSPSISNSVPLVSNQTNGIAVIGTGTNSAPPLPPLIPGSTYYLGVQNPNNVPVADACVEVDFNLLTTAYAFTEPAQLVTGTNAQLNGFATPNGYPSTAWFEWGTNTLYGNSTTPTPVGLGYSVVYVTNSISTVTNVPYHFRLVVSNVLGVVNGFDQILDEANVVAWGADYAGQINVPTNSNNITAIAGAYDHSLDLKTNGQVVAWGDNTFGQATVPAGLSNQVAVAVAGGEYYSMALKSDGTVTSWGANLLSQTNVPAGLSNVVLIAGGTYSSLALQNSGTVVAWGANFFGLTNVPASASNIVSVASGSYHSLTLKNDGTVTAWGDDGSGQTNVPTALNNVVAIAAGGFHSLALKSDGTVVAWGDNSAGQTNVPAGLTNVVAIAAGGFHSLALKSDGTMVTWGDDSAGQSSVPLGLTNVVAIAAGNFHSLALTPQILTNIFVLPIVPGVPQTNNISGNSITYYQVNVPLTADFATNTLLFATNGTLNIWFSTNTPPTLNATNATLLGGPVSSGTWILSATNGVPLLVPGSTYYLGVQNPNNFPVYYGIQVDFHLTTAVIPPPFTNVITISSIVKTNINGTNGFLLTWFAPSNDLFQVQWSSGIPLSWQTFTNPPFVSYNPNYPASATNAEFTFFDNGTQAPFTGPTRFYRLVQLGSLLNVSNGVPQTADVAPGGTAYYSITVPASADAATNALLSSTAPVNLLFNQIGLPTSPNAGGYTLLTGTTNGTFILNAGSVPPLLPGATYYLGVQNTNNFTVQFTLEVNFHVTPAPITNYPISNVKFVTGTTNGILLTWLAPTNYQFQIQWATSLTPLPVSWITVPGVVPTLMGVAGTTGTYQWFDDFSLTGGFGSGKFYRIIAYPPGVPVPAALVISSAKAFPGGGIQLQWAGSTNYVYDVLWATNLALASSSWNVLSNLPPPVLTYNAGVFTFTNNTITLSGGAPAVFFQVLELP